MILIRLKIISHDGSVNREKKTLSLNREARVVLHTDFNIEHLINWIHKSLKGILDPKETILMHLHARKTYLRLEACIDIFVMCYCVLKESKVILSTLYLLLLHILQRVMLLDTGTVSIAIIRILCAIQRNSGCYGNIKKNLIRFWLILVFGGMIKIVFLKFIVVF